MVLAVSLSAFLCYFCTSKTGKEIAILAGFAGVWADVVYANRIQVLKMKVPLKTPCARMWPIRPLEEFPDLNNRK